MTDLRQAAQAALENLEAVLCDPEGRAGIHGSDGDLKIIDEALDGLRAALAAQPVAFDHDIGADRYQVVKGSFWWHVRIGDSTANVGMFHTKMAAEDMALKLLTAFRDGAFMQSRAAQPQQATSCTDPHCPCRDGDACHYKDAADGTKAWAAQPVAQEPRVCWLVEEFSDSGNSTGRYMLDQNGLTITTDAQQARRFLGSRTATFRATDMREKWGTSWRPVSHVFRAAQPQQAEGDTP